MQPTNLVALNNLADVLAVRRKAPVEALPFGKRAVGLAPRNGSVIDTLAWVEHLLGNHEIAAALLQQAVQRQPYQPEIRLHTATVFLVTGKGERAAAELKEALRLDPTLEGRDDVRQLREKLAARPSPK